MNKRRRVGRSRIFSYPDYKGQEQYQDVFWQANEFQEDSDGVQQVDINVSSVPAARIRHDIDEESLQMTLAKYM